MFLNRNGQRCQTLAYPGVDALVDGRLQIEIDGNDLLMLLRQNLLTARQIACLNQHSRQALHWLLLQSCS